MRIWLAAFLAVSLVPGAAEAACDPGIYRSPAGEPVALSLLPDGNTRYLFVDGRRGTLADPDGPLVCKDGALGDRAGQAWTALPLQRIAADFTSHGTTLSGELLRPPGDTPRPMIVFVHGSETTSPRDSVYPLLFTALGVDVFIYDKRGTGKSGGQYTQNFELLADDAAAAMGAARRLNAGRSSRAGFFGGSQGGWVAPLASTRSQADFVVVGFGLTASPIEEDRDQVLDELRAVGASDADLAAAREITAATAQLVRSHFTSGFDQLATAKRRHAGRPWITSVRGEYTGSLLRESEADLRRVGRAAYDNLELIWDYDAVAALRRVKAPQLWIVAEQDREAPSAQTLKRLSGLRREGKDIAVFSFPDTDHGMVEYRQAADGSRSITRITDGYFRLIGDWVWQRPLTTYGRSRKH